MTKPTAWIVLVACLFMACPASAAVDGYYVVVAKQTQADPAWQAVVAELVTKHQAEVIAYEKDVEESLAGLRRAMPRYVCFVAKPTEATREFVVAVNRLVRRIDDDPYGDALWGILTGFDAAGALRIARQREPLAIDRVAAATEIDLDACTEGVWYCELKQGKMVRKRPGGRPEPGQAPPDTTKALVDTLNVEKAQLFVTSGHASERDWRIGYRYSNGQFRSEAGRLFGLDTAGQRWPVDSPNPKVYLPVGNCLMGHIDGPDAMALAFMQSAGVCQMAGYTVPTWYGYAGWGLLDYFVEQPGRYTLAEAFFANQQALAHRIETYFPGMAKTAKTKVASKGGAPLPEAARQAGLTANDLRGLLYDRDNIAFYGDPAWEARMQPGPLSWRQSLTVKDGVYRFEIEPLRGAASFQPRNTNGSQRGGRPFVALLPNAISAKDVEIVEGADLAPLVTRRCLIVPNPGKCDPARAYRVVFRVK